MKKLYFLLAVIFSLCFMSACSKSGQSSEESVLRVGMECAYPPYNWTQTDDSDGAVQIEGTNEFAAGYDVEMAKKVAEKLGKKLLVVKTDWAGLTPSVQSGKIDLIMAGMSPLPERREQVDFSEPYWKSDLVIIVKSDSKYASAKSLEDFKGAKLTAQLNTFHYTALKQVEGADIQEAMADFPQMRVALQSGIIDGYVAEVPEGISVEMAMKDVTYVKFAEGEGFKTDDNETSICAGMKKGSDLLKLVNEVFNSVSDSERQEIMNSAIKNQPVGE